MADTEDRLALREIGTPEYPMWAATRYVAARDGLIARAVSYGATEMEARENAASLMAREMARQEFHRHRHA